MLPIQDGVYRVSTSDRDLLTKNIGLFFQFLSSLNKLHLLRPLTPPSKGRVYRPPRGWPKLAV